MKIVYEYSHLGGPEILQVRYPEINNEVYQVIANIKAKSLKESKEKIWLERCSFLQQT